MSTVVHIAKKEDRQKLPKVILSCRIVSTLRLHLNTQISESRRLSNHSFANPHEQHGLYSIPSMADLNNNWIITRPLRYSYDDTVWRSLPLYVKSMCHWYLNLLTKSRPFPPNRDRLSIRLGKICLFGSVNTFQHKPNSEGVQLIKDLAQVSHYVIQSNHVNGMTMVNLMDVSLDCVSQIFQDKDII